MSRHQRATPGRHEHQQVDLEGVSFGTGTPQRGRERPGVLLTCELQGQQRGWQVGLGTESWASR